MTRHARNGRVADITERSTSLLHPHPFSNEELHADKLSMDGANAPTTIYQELYERFVESIVG